MLTQLRRTACRASTQELYSRGHPCRCPTVGNSPDSSGELKVQRASSDPMTEPASSFTPRNLRPDVSELPASGRQRPAVQVSTYELTGHLASGVCCSTMRKKTMLVLPSVGFAVARCGESPCWFCHHYERHVNLLLKEYLVSGEVSEAERCLRDLEVPHFHHELVYEAVVMVLESNGETAVNMMVKLLKAFWETGLITIDQMNRGFQRVYDELPDINLDVPHAHTIMEKFVDLCFQETVITKQLRDACPCRAKIIQYVLSTNCLLAIMA
ncbi:UNVERIFIED_CONTAM: hypothetical protein FKN15_042116 [Acipenser sinensis]